MKRISKVIGLVGLIAVLGFGCSRVIKPTEENKQDIDRAAILLEAKKQGLIMDTGEIQHMQDPAVLIVDEKKLTTPDWELLNGVDFKNWKAAALADVTGGTSYGLVHLNFSQGKFQVAATFGDLPETTNGSSYQAWLVKRGDGMKVLNLGELNAIGKIMTLTYASKMDLSEYDFFVVTLQTANATVPGEYLLEGVVR